MAGGMSDTNKGWTGNPWHPSLQCDYCGVCVAGFTAASLALAKAMHRKVCKPALKIVPKKVGDIDT
jgi:hypothetical protein